MSGTSEEAGQASAQEAEASEGMPPAVQEKLAELRARAEAAGEPRFGDLARSVGIDVESAPKPTEVPTGADSAPQEAASAPDATPDPEPNGFDTILAGARGQNPRLADDAAIEQEALGKGLPPGMARSLAKNTPRKEAREFLDSYGTSVQSEAAGQPAPQPPIAPSAGAPPVAAPVVDSQALEEALGSEEAATAVAGMIASLEARVAQAEQAAQLSAQVVQETTVAQQDAALRAEVVQAAGELKERFPQLVRGNNLDPQVAELASSLRFQTSRYPDMKSAMEAAAVLTFGGEGATRQQPTTPTHSPDLEAPTAALDAGGGPIDSYAAEELLSSVAQRYANDPGRRAAELKRVGAEIARRNRPRR